VKFGAKISERGEPAITLCEALAYYEDVDSGDVYTLVHLRIVTGRTHQIRVHMMHLGHPVVGDMQYVTDQALIDRDFKLCDRIFLHKFRIAFFNMKGEPVIRACPLRMAPKLWRALECLRRTDTFSLQGCDAPGLMQEAWYEK